MNKRHPVITFVVLLLLVPLFQQLIKPVDIYPLMGHYEVYRAPKLRDTTWFDKSFQAGFERYMNQNFGFRNLFVRFRNQLDWNLFREAHGRGILVGKEDFLFEKGYINGYLGRDYLGDSIIEEHARKMEMVVDFFDRINTPLLLVIAPGKAWYFPELMPESVAHLRKNVSSNYEKYLVELDARNIRHIDFNQYFMTRKEELGTLVFPKTGTHWSNYCAALALDSIARYAQTEFELEVPAYEITETDILWPLARHGDKDLENSMNLLTRIENFPSIYPKYTSDSTSRKPRVLVISDSFYYPMEDHITKVFDHEFWYYYNKHWEENKFPDNSTEAYRDYFEPFDMVMMMVTETGFSLFPWGFFDDLAPVYTNRDQFAAGAPSNHSRSSK